MKCIIYTADGHDEPIDVDGTLEEFIDTILMYKNKHDADGWLIYKDKTAIQIRHIVRIVKVED